MAKNIAINLDAPHPGQLEVLNNRKRFNVLSCGRRWGKTLLTYELIAEVVSYNLNSGLSEDMGYMSPSYKNLLPTWTKFVKTFEPIITRKSEQDYWAEIMGQFRIEFWSLENPENIRGRQYKRVIIDEAALMVMLRQMLKLIILPTVGDLRGDLWFFSTPRGFNDFHHYYKLGQNPLFPNWASWIRPTDNNPYFPKEELEEQRALLDPDEFAQEWEGKFVSLGNSPFDISFFKQWKNYDQALQGQIPLYNIRYWDIANSAKGDYTASVKFTITDMPEFIISDGIRLRGKWGQTYPSIKAEMLRDPTTLHLFETEGVGGIAWQMIAADPDLANVLKAPATRIFTQQNKQERANLWGLELRNKRMNIVQQGPYEAILEEIQNFPFGTNDDFVDSISGGLLGFIYFYGGYSKLLESKKIKPKEVGRIITYDKLDLIADLQDIWS